jgi:uracil phosphoribosyltransferase
MLIDDLQNRLQESSVDTEKLCFLIILRSGIALLPEAVEAFPHAPVGVAGVQRDETTYEPQWYYEKMPPLTSDSVVVILDPMLATGGSAETVISHVIEQGAKADHIHFVGVLAAQEGVERIESIIPKENIILADIDPELDGNKFIVPGLGDFGDRYFGFDDTHS